MSSPFGRALRSWRTARRLSQQDLSERAEVTTRHLSFLETGRSRPGEAMVLRLGEALGLPLRARNELLRAAGFDPRYDDQPWTDLGLLRDVVGQLLARHEPFPAVALDRSWRIVEANGAARATMLPGIALPVSTLWLLRAGPLRSLIVNWDQVASAAAERVRSELGVEPDPAVLGELRALEAEIRPGGPAPSAPVVVTEVRLGGERLRTFTTLCRFTSPRAVAAEELQVELVFPADDATRARFEALSAPSPPGA